MVGELVKESVLQGVEFSLIGDEVFTPSFELCFKLVQLRLSLVKPVQFCLGLVSAFIGLEDLVSQLAQEGVLLLLEFSSVYVELVKATRTSWFKLLIWVSSRVTSVCICV